MMKIEDEGGGSHTGSLSFLLSIAPFIRRRLSHLCAAFRVLIVQRCCGKSGLSLE